MEAKNPAAPAKPGPAKPKPVVEAYTFRKIGWPYIRKAGITFGVTLLLSCVLVTAVRLVLLQVRPGTMAAQARQSAASERFTQAEIERAEIRDFLPKFEQLRVRGFVGPESRLSLLEAIQTSQKTRRLLPVTFDFSPQQIVAVDPSLLEPPLELHSTAVHVKMELLHEMDLVNFFQDLKARGFYTVKDCLLTAFPDVAAGSQAPRLSADCTLYWLTVGTVAPDPNAPPDPNAVPAAAGG